VDRCLPLPTRENKDEFLEILKQKIESGEAGGLIFETIVGDAGIVKADPELMNEVVELLKGCQVGNETMALPIIMDGVQQATGRSDEDYWGLEGYDAVRDYENLIVTTAKSASNGQPFGFTLMPRNIAEAAFPVTQVTTNSLNGALLRACIVADIVNDPRIKKHVDRVGKTMEEVATSHNLGLRGNGMNRGIYTETPELMEMTQFALLMERGILVGALPSTIRFQPCLLEDEETVRLLMESTISEFEQIRSGDIAPNVQAAFDARTITSGLNVKVESN
jgi:acetylornithine/succinyldiaminopimelate/putrescine aminotransferase